MSMRMSRSLWIGGTLAVAPAALGAAGCSSTSSGSSEPTKIAFVDSLTGSLSGIGAQCERATLLAVRDINNAGGILGNPIVLEEQDDTSDPATGAMAAQSFIGEGHDFIYGPLGSSIALQILPMTVPAHVFVFGAGTSSPAFTTYDTQGWFARTSPTQTAPGHALAEYAVADGNMKIAMIAISNSAEQARADAFQDRATSLGATITTRINYPDNTPADYDYPGTLQQAFATNPDAVVLISYITDGVRFLTTWKTQGAFSGKWYLSDAFLTPDVPANVGAEWVEGMKAVQFARPQDAYWQYFHDQYTSAYSSEEPGVRTAEFFDGMMIAALAMVRANSMKSADWRQYVREVADPPGVVVGPGEFAKAVQLIQQGMDVNYEGAGGPVDIDQNGDVPTAPIQEVIFHNGVITPLGFYTGN